MKKKKKEKRMGNRLTSGCGKDGINNGNKRSGSPKSAGGKHQMGGKAGVSDRKMRGEF